GPPASSHKRSERRLPKDKLYASQLDSDSVSSSAFRAERAARSITTSPNRAQLFLEVDRDPRNQRLFIPFPLRPMSKGFSFASLLAMCRVAVRAPSCIGVNLTVKSVVAPGTTVDLGAVVTLNSAAFEPLMV